MKKHYSILAALLFTSATFGQGAITPEQTKPAVKEQPKTIKEQLDAMQKEVDPLLAVRAANKKTLEVLKQTKSDLDVSAEALGKAVEKYKADKASYDIDLAAYTPAAASLNAALASHNANRCQKSSGNDCAAYEEEATQLNTRRDYLQTVKNGLDARMAIMESTRLSLLELSKTNRAKFDKLNADAKAYDAQNDPNEAKIAAIAERWKVVVAPLHDCLVKAGVVKYATSDQIKKACGEAYDGIPVDKKAVVQ